MGLLAVYVFYYWLSCFTEDNMKLHRRWGSCYIFFYHFVCIKTAVCTENFFPSFPCPRIKKIRKSAAWGFE